MADTKPRLRLHMPGIPHTITTDAYSHCAFTGKVKKFAPMMHTLKDAAGNCVYEVYHYGVEGSDSGADVEVQLFTRKEWDELRVASYKTLCPGKPLELLDDPTQFVGDLANIGSPLYREFNVRLKQKLAQHYRGRDTDLVCLPLGPAHQAALTGMAFGCLETGIGYGNPYETVRVYESQCWYHYHMGKAGTSGQNYHFVVPNYFDAAKWPLFMHPVAKRPQIGFFGRICHIKGLDVLCAVAERCPDMDFIICGQGDPKPYLRLPNVRYEPPIHGDKRAEFLGSLHALLAPSIFVEPFCGVSVEAQLCGTPVIGPAYGATTETVEHGKTGFLAHTLPDYVLGVRSAAQGQFDRSYIRQRAASKYSLEAVAPLYDAVFRTAIDLFSGPGWYSQQAHMPSFTVV